MWDLRFSQRWCLPPAYLLVLVENLVFDPEDGGDTFLRNVGCISTDYTASHPRRWYSSKKKELNLWYSSTSFRLELK
jgi:hypothetical protein